MPIRVLLVEDSLIVLTILKRILSTSPEIEVVGTARNGQEAIALIPQVKPQVICTDLHMPLMNGLELTQAVMATSPRPILVISASVQDEDSENVFQLLQAGALDIFPKPVAGLPSDYERLKQELITKIKILSGVSVFTQRFRKQPPFEVKNKPTETGISSSVSSFRVTPRCPRIITIGASTGGPQALQNILSQFPSSCAIPIVCIQHISEGFLQGLVNWLGGECKLPVKTAVSGEFPQAGTIYFPMEGQHLEIDSRGRFIHSLNPPLGGHRPSITVTFESIAKFYGPSAIGVLLTGMGRDGADGLLAIARAGGFTIAQDEKSSVVFGMPKEAIALNAAQQILPLPDIAPSLISRLMLRPV